MGLGSDITLELAEYIDRDHGDESKVVRKLLIEIETRQYYVLSLHLSGERPGYEYHYDYYAEDQCVPCGVDMYSNGSHEYEMCSPCKPGFHTDGLTKQNACIPLLPGRCPFFSNRPVYHALS